MKRLIIPALLALAACDRPASDGYRYGQAEFDRSEIALSVRTYPDLHALQSAADALGIASGGIMAFGQVATGEPACTIHVLDPAVDYQPEWIGHEIVHCMRGRWHK